MTYIQGFVAAVPTANRNAYLEHARHAMALFKEFGAFRSVEAWGDDLPRGKVNDFQGAVKANEDETVVFSLMEYPDKPTRDAAFEKMMNDPRVRTLPEMPLDGKRMVFGGFDVLVDAGSARGNYLDGCLLAVPVASREAYRDMARECAEIFLDHGALRVVDAWGDDVPEGKLTDFHRAVRREDGEQVIFSWVEWPARQARDEGGARVMEDARMKPWQQRMPFDGNRMVYGGFESILDA